MFKMAEKLNELKKRVQEISDLKSVSSVLFWDQATYMPPGGSEARGRQVAAVERIAQEKFTNPEIGRLLDDLQPYADSIPYDSDEASFVRVTRREYEKAIKIPPDFLSAFYEHASKSYNTWTEARPANDFARVRPLLEKTLDFSRRTADFFPGYEHIADPLIDLSDYGMKASTVRKVFGLLREELVPIVKAITSQAEADSSCLKQHFPEEKQLDFSRKVIEKFGYDFSRGRQDKTHHPFEIKISIGDVRITTRIKEDDFGYGFFSTTHESGHALYEQGVKPDYEGTLLNAGTSSGVHESQSRTWENIVSRSRPFWEYFYPELQKFFPEQLASVSLDTFYRAVNMVKRSLIRTEADEVTYNLHVMIRFELELLMLEGKLEVKDLPEAWHAAYNSNLGITAPSDIDGCLQDVHWFGGYIGGEFQGYTLGNIMSAQFYEAALAGHPEIESDIGRGEFGTLLSWLSDNIYVHGSKYTAPELLSRVCGGASSCESSDSGTGLDIAPYIRYLRAKFGEIYSL